MNSCSSKSDGEGQQVQEILDVKGLISKLKGIILQFRELEMGVAY